MKEYCLGFAFDGRYQQVLLIQKNKPEWQAGKINGIGGKIEKGETPKESMIREFKEESGITTNAGQWNSILEMRGEDWVVYVFSSFTNQIFSFINTTDEKCGIHSINRLPLNVLANVNWLVPMCLDTSVNSKESIIKFW